METNEWNEDIRQTINVNIMGSIATHLEALKAFKKHPERDHAIVFITSLGLSYFRKY